VRFQGSPNLLIEKEDVEDDIRSFIHSGIDEAITKKRLLGGQVSPELRRTIESALFDKSGGM